MQTSLPLFNCNSTPDMQPAEKPRVSGRRSASVSIRYESRQASQQQLAERLGPTQQAYAHWERNTVALRPEQLLSLVEALNVSVDDLVGTDGTRKRGAGPTGKMKQLFEAASRLRALSSRRSPPSSKPSSINMPRGERSRVLWSDKAIKHPHKVGRQDSNPQTATFVALTPC